MDFCFKLIKILNIIKNNNKLKKMNINSKKISKKNKLVIYG
jgi:hypothetical protein